MKIGIDARFWNETGVGRYIRNLVLELSQIDKKNDYVLFVREIDSRAITKLLPKKNWKVISTDIHWHSLKEQREFPKVLLKENLDLMHFPYFSVPTGYSRPYVVTIHDLILHHFSTGEATTLPLPLYKLKLEAYKYIIKNAAKKSVKIFAVSQTTKDEIIDHLGVKDEKIVVTYEGIDKTIVPAKTTSISQDTSYFLHVGNVYPHKNAKRLVDAFKAAQFQNTKLIFVGKKDYFMQKLEDYVTQKNLQETIVFKGFVNDEELAVLYQNALATVVPSLMEGFGLPVLEAMANSCLVLASNIPSIREIAGGSIMYFEVNNTLDLTEKLQAIVQASPTTFTAQKKSALERTEAFTWEKMAKETLGVYESCLSV